MTSTESLIATFINNMYGGDSSSVQVIDPSFYLKNIVDEASATVTYVGYALPGSSVDDPVWTIKRITESGTTTTSEFANGIVAADQVWSDRASLQYS